MNHPNPDQASFEPHSVEDKNSSLPEVFVVKTDDELKPLSDRDRDFLLDLLDNPPEPTPAFIAAAARYKKRHG